MIQQPVEVKNQNNSILKQILKKNADGLMKPSDKNIGTI
jgi:hypothetical protein